MTWSLNEMGTRLKWERTNLDRKPQRSLKDEREFLEKSFTTKWLAEAEEREASRKARKVKQRPKLW